MKLKKLVQNEEFVVGIGNIDKQHKILTETLKNLQTIDRHNVRSKVLVETLCRMTEYSNFHFEIENKFMEMFNYPDQDEHKNEHREFLKKTAEFNLGVMNTQLSIPNEVMTYLENWITNHFLKSDVRLKNFYDKNNLKRF